MNWLDEDEEDDDDDDGGGGGFDDELLWCGGDVEKSDRRLHWRRKISRDESSNREAPLADLLRIYENKETYYSVSGGIF